VSDAPAVVDLLSAASLDALDAAGPVEVVVGVHVANQARRIPDVLDGIASKLEACAVEGRAGVLVADAGSQDATPDAIGAWCESESAGPTRGFVDVVAPRHRGRAVRALLLAARRLGAHAVALVDGDVVTTREDWLQALLEPVLRDEADYVSPAYARSVSEGTLTTNLLAPLTRALFGAPLQQVMGGCAAVSGQVMASWLGPLIDADDWPAHAPELWLTASAVAAGARVAEVQLDRKVVTPGMPQPDLATILVRTVGPLFGLMERHQTAWLNRGAPVPVLHRGDRSPVHADARSPAVDQMVRAFDLGLKDLLPVWEQIIPESTLARLYPLALLAADEFRLPAPLWARIVSDFAVAYHDRRLPREHLLRAMTPLYLGRTAAFIVHVRAMPPGRMPEALETIDRAFEDERDHLVARWR